jgi:hypothetical protein
MDERYGENELLGMAWDGKRGHVMGSLRGAMGGDLVVACPSDDTCPMEVWLLRTTPPSLIAYLGGSERTEWSVSAVDMEYIQVDADNQFDGNPCRISAIIASNMGGETACMVWELANTTSMSGAIQGVLAYKVNDQYEYFERYLCYAGLMFHSSADNDLMVADVYGAVEPTFSMLHNKWYLEQRQSNQLSFDLLSIPTDMEILDMSIIDGTLYVILEGDLYRVKLLP